MAKEKAAAKAVEEDKDDADAPKEDGEGAAAPEGEDGEGAAAADTGKKPFWKKKKFIVIGAAVLVLLLGGGGAALYFMGIIGPHKTEEAAAEAGHEAKKDDKDRKHVFYDLGDLLVNLSGEGKRPNFLKLKISIELEEETDKPKLEQLKPRILDDFQSYLRELRVDDLKGSAGIYRLREELLLRVTEAVHPARVRDVLITEMLVQ